MGALLVFGEWLADSVARQRPRSGAVSWPPPSPDSCEDRCAGLPPRPHGGVPAGRGARAAPVLRGGGGVSELRRRPPVRAASVSSPRRAGAASDMLPVHRHAVGLRQRGADDPGCGQRTRRGSGLQGGLCRCGPADRRDDRAAAHRPPSGTAQARSQAATCLHLQHEQGGLREDGDADEGIHQGRRHLSGRAFAALAGVDSGPAV